MGCRLAGGLSLDQESCDNHASHPLLPPPRLCLAPHPVPLASDYVGTEEKVSSAHCRTRLKEGWDVDGICYDAFHLPLDSFPQFKSRALILPPIPAPQMQAWWWNEYGVCVCVWRRDAFPSIIAPSFWVYRKSVAMPSWTCPISSECSGKKGEWEPPLSMIKHNPILKDWLDPQGGQIHLSTPTALFVTSMPPPQYPSLCPVQSRWSTRFVDWMNGLEVKSPNCKRNPTFPLPGGAIHPTD